jgi:HlyD family secretion protein
VKKRIVIIVFAALLVGAGLFVYFGQRQNRLAELSYSGTIEATQANLSFQAAGRVGDVFVKEGERVGKDQRLARLAPEEFDSRVAQAAANLERAVQNRAQSGIVLDLYRRTLPEDIARAEANVRAQRGIAVEAEKNHRRYEQLFQRGVVAEKERDAVRLNHDTARARLDEGEASLAQARGNLKKIEAARKDLDAAEAFVAASRAALEQARIQRGYTELRAPFAGIVTSRNIEPGETVSPGREALTLTDLAEVDLKIFINETEIGRVRPGQAADVRVDAFPDRVFRGTVAFMSPEGEFTPKIIQTKKERVKLVYLVKVKVPNPDLSLKPGMPADAWLK